MISTLLFAMHLASAALVAAEEPLSLRIREHAPLRARSLDVVTENYAVLSRSNIESRSSRFLRLLRRDFKSTDKPIGTAPLTDLGGLELIMNITLDGREVSLICDTGSSDLWVPAVNFTCVDDTKKVFDEKECGLGTFRFDGTPSGGWIPDVHMHLSYGPNGQMGTGPSGYANVTVAGINVPKQQIGVINYTNFAGDYHTSGIIGFGFPLDTNAYKGTNASADTPDMQVVYDGIATTIMKNHKEISSFSMAQPRNSETAYMAFGGVPPGVPFEDKFASTPIRTAEIFSPTLKGQYLYYIINPDGWVYDGAKPPAAAGTNATGRQPFAIVDSGTTAIYVPTEVFTAVSKGYQPPAITNVPGQDKIPHAPCNATPPAFGVAIGGMTFNVSKADMFWTGGKPVDVSGTKYCPTSVRDGGDGTSGQPYILGHAFLKNVVTVYDIGAAQMRFAALKE